jgi:hypothetical protein
VSLMIHSSFLLNSGMVDMVTRVIVSEKRSLPF